MRWALVDRAAAAMDERNSRRVLLFEQRTDVEGSGRACPSTSQHIQHAGWNRNPSISLGRKGWMAAWEGGAVQ